MSDEPSVVEAMMARFPRQGRVEWIGLSPGRRMPIEVVDEARAEVGSGLQGDRHATSGQSRRQITLIQHEHLAVIGALMGELPVDPARLRRNVVVSGIPLAALKGRRFRVGDALLEGTKPCDPCSRMEEELGPGGYNAMRGMGGLCAVVLAPGDLRVGSSVVIAGSSASSPMRSEP